MDFIITATRSMRTYAARVVEQLLKFPEFNHVKNGSSINAVQVLKTDSFADGEMEVVIEESIRGKDVILFTSCARNEENISVNEAKIELYHTIDALKRGQARKIIVFEPYVSCSRSDRTARRSSVGLWCHLKTLAGLGMEHFITYQLHSDKSKSMLDPNVCVIDDIPGHTLLKRYLCDTYIRNKEFLVNEVRPQWAFCSVDAGGEKLARDFANAFGAPLVVAHKQRDYTKVNTIESVNILSAEPLAGKILWIVDDMIDTGGSVKSLIRSLADHKPKEINIIIMHALFSNPAPAVLNQFTSEGLLNRIVASDTVYHPCLTNQIANLEVVPSANLSAKIIKNIVTNSPMSKLFKAFNVEKYLASQKLFNG
ncbi:MAG: ribose-phosphate diphosphokinase [Treponema sp.]|jgi:ribose-phosphate pyrophosphokinase|nr:ribose-phosphate diphosphokinase [Treponema sp.]